MEKLLLAGILVNDDAMQALAFQRGVAVKGYLASKDLPPERLFLGASNSGKVDAKADVKPDAKWVPRADLNIAMQQRLVDASINQRKYALRVFKRTLLSYPLPF